MLKTLAQYPAAALARSLKRNLTMYRDPSHLSRRPTFSLLTLIGCGLVLASPSVKSATGKKPVHKSSPASAHGKKIAQLPSKPRSGQTSPATDPAALGVDLAPDPFTPSVNIVMKNRSKATVTSRIVLSNPDNFLGAARSVQSLTVPAGGQSRIKFQLPCAAMAPDSRYSFTAEVETPGAKITATRLLSFFRIERAWNPPALDGTMEGWLNASMIIVSVPGRYPGKPGWKGRPDMTATARFLWDTNHLYVMARRTDDTVTTAASATDPNGDRIRLALSPTGSHLSDASWVTVDLVPTAKGVAVMRNSAPALKLKSGPIPGATAFATDQNGVTVVVAAIPWKELGVTKGLKTKRLGLTIRSIDDDGEGLKSWLEWGGGAGSPADPPSFSDVSLGD
jgi:hypothetical protein